MADIFLSYASADRERIRPLVKKLEEHGWSVWWDRKIPPGKTWHQVIQQAIDDAKCVVVVWSQQSIQSDWVITEAEEGKERHNLIPVMIDNVKAPLAFRRIQAARLTDWDGEPSHHEIGVLFEAIKTIVGEPEKSQEVVKFEERAEKPQASSDQALETHLNPAQIAQAGQEHSPPQTQSPDNGGLYDTRIRTKDDFDDNLDTAAPSQAIQDSPGLLTHIYTSKEVPEPGFGGGPTLPDHKDTSYPLRLRLIIGVALIVIALVIANWSYSYFKQQAQARSDQQQAQMKIEKQNHKEALIGSLRDRIAELNRRLQPSNNPALIKMRNDISESLDRLSRRLDDVNKMSSDQLSEISKACDEIGKELNKIEEEINNLQG
jgi:hypothetical protein